MANFVAKRILITGSGTGIGKASAIALAKKGHTVYAATYSEAQAEEMTALGTAEKMPVCIHASIPRNRSAW